MGSGELERGRPIDVAGRSSQGSSCRVHEREYAALGSSKALPELETMCAIGADVHIVGV